VRRFWSVDDLLATGANPGRGGECKAIAAFWAGEKIASCSLYQSTCQNLGGREAGMEASHGGESTALCAFDGAWTPA